jgi:Flp pilus assembly protein CpaB
VWRWRLVLVVLGALIVLRLAIPGLVEDLRHTADVLVTARDVTVGEVFDEDALTVAQFDVGAIPAGALTAPSQAIGSRATANLPAGYPLASGLVNPAGALANAPPGAVAIPVRLSDAAAASVLAPGDRVDVLAAGGTSAAGEVAPAQRVASGAVVLAIPDVGEATPGVVLLAVTPDEAALVGGAGAWSVLSAVMVG